MTDKTIPEMSKEEQARIMEEQFESMTDEEREEKLRGFNPALQFGPHVLGGIEARLTDREGNQTSARLTIEDAAVALVHLQALITMAFQTAYAQMAAMEQAQSKIVVPGK